MIQSGSKKPNWRARFIRQLPYFHKDRGAIATLRRGVSLQEEDWLAMGPYVHGSLGALEETLSPRERQAAYLITALYADYDRPDLAPPMTDEGNMGSHFAALREEEAGEGAEERLKRRFLYLLNTHPDDLSLRLRDALRYLRAQSDPPMAINWRRLLDDFIAWGEEKMGTGWPVYYRSVQRRWAIAFWQDVAPQQTWWEVFFPSLWALAREKNRGAMAALQRGVGMTAEGLAHIAPYLYGLLRFPARIHPSEKWERWEWAAFLVAALFADYGGEAVGTLASQLDDQARRKRPWEENLGHYFARLRRKGRQAKEHNRRVERHFMALLVVDSHDLPSRLREALSYLKSQAQPTISICWEQLFWDIVDWDDEDYPARLRWAKAFWGTMPRKDKMQSKRKATR